MGIAAALLGMWLPPVFVTLPGDTRRGLGEDSRMELLALALVVVAVTVGAVVIGARPNWLVNARVVYAVLPTLLRSIVNGDAWRNNPYFVLRHRRRSVRVDGKPVACLG